MVVFSYYQFDPRPRRAAEALANAGMPVELICLRGSGDDPKHEVLNGVSVRRVSVKRRRGGVFGYFYQYAAFLLIVATILGARSLKRRYHLVYVHNMPDFLVFSGWIPKLFGAKVILDLHDPMPELLRTIFGLPEGARSVAILKRLEKWSMAFADSVVTVNRACARIFASRSCPREKITVVMNTPDERLVRFRPKRVGDNGGRADGAFVIMYHGSMVERNGLDLAVEAFAAASGSIPGAELRIYGSRNAFLDRVMDSVRERGLGDAVRYLGEKPVEEIAAAIGECDLGVIPNRQNIFTELNTPTRIFEYLASGKPVIAPRAPGICDYFGEDALVFFELGDAGDLARKIEYVFHHPEEVNGIVRRGQEVHRAHTWQQERAKLTGLVGSLCGDPPRARAAAQSKGPRPPRNRVGL